VYIIWVVYINGGSVHSFMNNQTASIITSIIIDVTLTLDKMHKTYAPPVYIL